MSIESRLKRGDNPDDVKALFPHQTEEIDRILKSMNPKKKAARKSKS